MKYFVIALAFVSFNAMACWNMKGTISVNNDKVQIDQTINHDQTYSFTGGNHIFHVKIPSKFETPPNLKNKKDIHSVEIGVQEKKGITLSEMIKGKVIVQTGKEATMTKEDLETGVVTTFVIKITEI
jgi:hypothetical protein